MRCGRARADRLGALVVPLPGYTIHLDMHLAMLDVDLALADVAGCPTRSSRGSARWGSTSCPPSRARSGD